MPHPFARFARVLTDVFVRAWIRWGLFHARGKFPTFGSALNQRHSACTNFWWRASVPRSAWHHHLRQRPVLRALEVLAGGAARTGSPDHQLGPSPKEFIRGLWRTIAQGQVWRGELRNRAKDGSIYWVDTTIVPLLNADGKPHQYLAIRSDITQRKAVEQQLADQAALAQLGQLATVVAHEVRNPLAGVKGSLQVLRSRPAIDPDDKRVIDAMISRLDVLNNKVEDILRFARPRTPVLGSPGRIGTTGRLGKRWSGSIGGACCRWRRRLIGDVL
jgi:signal transduction histidine kinase